MEIIDPIYCVNKERNKKFEYEMNMSTKEMKNLLPTIGGTNKKKLTLWNLCLKLLKNNELIQVVTADTLDRLYWVLSINSFFKSFLK